MVSYKFCEKLIQKVGKAKYEVEIFGEEFRPAYDRVQLSSYFSGKTAEDLSMAPSEWYAENDIKLHLGELITEVDTVKKTVKSHNGKTSSYDKLILATGSGAFVPPIEGVDKEGVFVYRTIEDLDAITEYAKKCKKGAVMGGGLLGLEAAKAVLDLGLETHVIEFADRLMPRQVDGTGADILTSKINEFGVKIHCGMNTRLIEGDDGVMTGMSFADDSKLDVEMLVISAGIKPRDEVARQAGLEVGPRGGIVVNNKMQTSNPEIYAIGECALHEGMIYGLVAPGYEMAEVALASIEGEDKEFTGFDMSTKLKLIGTDVASFGDAFGIIEGSRTIVYEDANKGVYKRINIDSEGKYLLGGMLVGDASDYNILLQMVNNQMLLPENPEDLILGARGGSDGAAMGVSALPDSAMICSCENVTKGDIMKAIEEGEIQEVGEIKACTKAGTGCGGCAPMLDDLLIEAKKASGQDVKAIVCEHFDYTRQEIFDIIKISGIKDYYELLEKHGKGDGCEKCKPAVASMIASIFADQILDQNTILDTNDKFLANVQRGGTYSIVPRVQGGEITPDKLIALGTVAKKYDLYCKITGGQRVDLFGAHLNDLPVIWEELIEAGFESGLAYGKSMRTVKSCVGSSWCRFGVQDSTSLAIRVEDRYKGVRSPHKLKSAVSGCVRECAEAQNKDFGIIATDKGWNLYVGGNGGAKPQHGWLLAADIDEDTLIKYVDRYLMFYIRTAEPLMRTATWMNKLEGGIEYLKEVVIEDKLGICHILEAEMQNIVDSYTCEWKDAVENPEKRATFQNFINSNEKDQTLPFERVRGQKQPKAW